MQDSDGVFGPQSGAADFGGAPDQGQNPTLGDLPQPAEMRIRAVMAAARHHGTDLDRNMLRVPAGSTVEAPILVDWVRNAGLWARAERLSWRNLVRFSGNQPVVLLLKDGSAAVFAGVNAERWTQRAIAAARA